MPGSQRHEYEEDGRGGEEGEEGDGRGKVVG